MAAPSIPILKMPLDGLQLFDVEVNKETNEIRLTLRLDPSTTRVVPLAQAMIQSLSTRYPRACHLEKCIISKESQFNAIDLMFDSKSAYEEFFYQNREISLFIADTINLQNCSPLGDASVTIHNVDAKATQKMIELVKKYYPKTTIQQDSTCKIRGQPVIKNIPVPPFHGGLN